LSSGSQQTAWVKTLKRGGEGGAKHRNRVKIRGAVQGVGFRPFVFRLAHELELSGWVGNDPRGVVLEAEGSWGTIQEFLRRLKTDGPAVARVESITTSTRPVLHSSRFTIRSSDSTGPPRTQILPDLATCPQCLDELLDAGHRRYGYPFTNCTHCGPRFTIIQSLPYDRPRTTMAGFPLCVDCREEYQDPSDRRFHAQPNACPRCGPRVELWDAAGSAPLVGAAAMEQAAVALRAGLVVAVKGLGGFHLMASATVNAPQVHLSQD
jgi:hydrogenase maturation protein HypF